jgi:hypothetical protein
MEDGRTSMILAEAAAGSATVNSKAKSAFLTELHETFTGLS